MPAGSFHEAQFPPSISQGATGGAVFSTVVQKITSGREFRISLWSERLGEWDVATGLRTPQQVEELDGFFHARFGKAFGFRFKWWADYRCPRWRATPGDLVALPTLFQTDGATATFQLTKVYGTTPYFYVRNIYKPVNGSVHLFDGSTPLVEGPDFTVSYVYGIVTLSGALQGTSGHNIRGYFEFDTPARFDTDHAKFTIFTTDNYAWGQIPVVETRDID